MASARENDLNPNTYIGLSFPLRKDSNNDFRLTKNSLEQSRHNLRNLLLTYPGERLGQPQFGSRLRQLVFEQVDEELPSRIEEEVKRSISQWLPYINVLSVQTLTDEGDTNKIFVKLEYSTTLNPDTINQIELDASSATSNY